MAKEHLCWRKLLVNVTFDFVFKKVNNVLVHMNFVWKISPTKICVKFYPILQLKKKENWPQWLPL